ncbi:MAG: ferrous iron transporter B [Planctomycetaceae bacterium]
MSSEAIPKLSILDSSAPAVPAVARIALVGNPNTGKTTFFNRLTGLRARTANYPGITVDLRKGPMTLNGSPVEILDLPGLYSLHASSPEERVAKSILEGEHAYEAVPDAVVLVLDATNLKRNLFLASEILELQLPTLVVLNLFDAAQKADIRIEVERLKEELRCPVVAVSSKKGSGFTEFRTALKELLDTSSQTPPASHPSCTLGCTGCTFAARYDWAEQVSGRTVTSPDHLGKRTAAIDRVLTHPLLGVVAFLALMLGVFYLIFSLASVPMDLVDGAFATLGDAANDIIPDGPVHPALWFPLAAVLSWLTFVGCYALAKVHWTRISTAVAAGVSTLVGLLPLEDFRSLVVDGLIAGVGGVVIFLPQICILFFLISLLEDSGYMARAAFVMERLMRFVGLPGKAFVPMLSAHACAIPGIMAARVIENWRDRLVTILVLPLLTCSARLPVYAMITALLFSESPMTAAMVFVGAYLLGIGAALFSAWCLKKTILKGEAIPLVIELPSYRLPGLRNALTTVIERGVGFIRQAGTVILMISVILWALATYPKLPADTALTARAETKLVELQAVETNSLKAAELHEEIERLRAQQALGYSFVGRAGRLVEPVFAPLGFDWKINVGVMTSFAAREVVVSTLAIVYGLGEKGADDEATLVETLRRQKRDDGTPVFTTATGLSLLVFFVLAMQCLPTQAVTRRETGSWKWAAFQLAYMTVMAYVAALAMYQTGCAIGLG